MSVIVMGMETPKNCKECPLGRMDDIDFDYVLYCTANKKYADLDMYDHPMGWKCPIIEVPPHGRLIDGDELKSKFRHGNGDDDADSAWISTIRRFITQADTIIEAED